MGRDGNRHPEFRDDAATAKVDRLGALEVRAAEAEPPRKSLPRQHMLRRTGRRIGKKRSLAKTALALSTIPVGRAGSVPLGQ